MKYTVKKNRKNRTAFRLLGAICLLVGALQICMLIIGYGRERIIGNIICIFIMLYGAYLFFSTFKKQYYDITYYFNDNDITIEHKYGKTIYSYEDVNDVSVVVPDEEMLCYMLHLKIKNDNFVIPFTFKKDLCEKIYNHINSRISTENNAEKQVQKNE